MDAAINNNNAGGLTKAEFTQIYFDVANVYENDQARAKAELPDLIPEIKKVLSHRRSDVTNLALTYFFCDLFGQYGQNVQAAWKEATERTDQAGAIDLQLDHATQLRIEPTKPELKLCPGPNCSQRIRTDLDYCLACRNRHQRLRAIRTTIL